MARLPQRQKWTCLCFGKDRILIQVLKMSWLFEFVSSHNNDIALWPVCLTMPKKHWWMDKRKIRSGKHWDNSCDPKSHRHTVHEKVSCLNNYLMTMSSSSLNDMIHFLFYSYTLLLQKSGPNNMRELFWTEESTSKYIQYTRGALFSCCATEVKGTFIGNFGCQKKGFIFPTLLLLLT